VNILDKVFPALRHKAEVETRLFEITLMLTVIIPVFYTIYGFFYGYDWPVQLIYGSAAVIYASFYLLYLKWSTKRWLLISYYVTEFFLLALAWFPSGGTLGAVTNIFVLIFISGLLVLRVMDFRKVIVLALAIFLGFSSYEYLNPEISARYTDYSSWILDITVSNTVMLLVLALTLYFYKTEYAKDRSKLQKLNQTLKDEKLRAEASDKAKAVFLSSVSHEIRTPLNGIMGNLELLQTTGLNEEQAQLVKDLSYSGDVLNGLISDLLDISLINESGILIQKSRMNLKEVITNVIQFFIPKVALKEGNVSIHFNHDERIPAFVNGDMIRTRQVLINLINNAVKFTEEGSINVQTELINLSENQVDIRVSVNDTGIGIPDEMQSAVFDTFQRTPNLGKNGMGLGLSICKKVIEAMNGRIGLKNTSQAGSSFFFEVPYEPIQEYSEFLDTSLVEKSYSKISVLIAEDQEMNQLVIAKMLKNIGVEHITVVSDGERAVEKALSEHYDFVLMDLRMPKKDGVQAAIEILELSNTPPVILAITANATQSEMENCLSAGMKGFITKPLNLETLQSSIDKHLV